MSNKNKSFFKTAAITGAVIGSACAAAGNAFIDRFLSRNGIKKTAAAGGVVSEEDCACFYKSDEAVAGITFYRERVYKDVFTFNKFGVCLHSIFYEAEKPSDVYAISCHGYTGDPSQNSVYARRFFEMGYNVLLPYLRGHGKSEHNYCTMGWLDRLDIIDWINFIIDKNPNAKIILHGASMGAATVMMATGEELPENVICCIEDCGFTSLWDQYSIQIRESLHLPPELVLNIVNQTAKYKLGFNLKEASAVKQVKKSKTPTLFIHGDCDSVVPLWMSYTLYKNAACEKERLVVPGATHAASGYVYPDIYWAAITEFINKYI